MGAFFQEELIDEVDLLCLVYQARQGDETALVAIFDLLKPALLGMVSRAPISEREDMVQESFIRLQYCVQHYKPCQGPFLHYARHSLYAFTKSYPRFAYQPLSEINGHEAVIDPRFDIIDMRETIDSLPAKDRTLVEAYIGRAKTITEVAVVVKQSPKQVSRRLATIFTKLRESL